MTMIKHYVIISDYPAQRPRATHPRKTGCTTLAEYQAKYGGDFFDGGDKPMHWFPLAEGHRLWRAGDGALWAVQVPAEEVVAA